MTCLLDVNLLVALTWRAHVFHAPATRWFAELALEPGDQGEWATTTVTETGLVRTSMNAGITEDAVAWTTALRMLDAVRATPGHRWWPDDVDLVTSEVVRSAPVVGHRQVTDVHLVALAVRHGGRLATLDRSIADAVHPDHRSAIVQVPVT